MDTSNCEPAWMIGRQTSCRIRSARTVASEAALSDEL